MYNTNLARRYDRSDLAQKLESQGYSMLRLIEQYKSRVTFDPMKFKQVITMILCLSDCIKDDIQDIREYISVMERVERHVNNLVNIYMGGSPPCPP